MAVTRLPKGQDEPQWVARASDHAMHVGTEAATAASQGFVGAWLPIKRFLAAPAAPGGARTTVLSTNRYSRSGSSATWSSSACQTPCSPQRAYRLSTLFPRPSPSGKQRHRAPVRAIQSTASTNGRSRLPARWRCQDRCAETHRWGSIVHCVTSFLVSYSPLNKHVNRT